MDALGIKPVVAQPAAVRSAPALPVRSETATSAVKAHGADVPVEFDARVAEARRAEALARAARNVPQPLGTQTFTMFKDVTGQMVTRYFDRNTGKATYIPEPQLLRMANNAGSQGLVNIKI